MAKTTNNTIADSNLGELKAPGRSKGLIDVVLHYRYLLNLIVKKEMKARYRGSFLGRIWTYIKPLTQFLIYFFFFGVVFGMKARSDVGGNFAVFQFSGLCAINLFVEVWRNATTSIRANAALVQKIYLPRELFPLSAWRVAFSHFIPQVIILLSACLFTGWHPTIKNIIAILFGITIISIFALGLGLIFAGINVFFQDAENFVDLFGMVATWATPVLYHWSLLKQFLGPLINVYFAWPLTAACELMHYGFLQYPYFDNQNIVIPHIWRYGLIALLFSIIVCILGQIIFRKLEGKFAQEL
ncbi:MAG: ABC transporter permease [Candidatus Ancillula sp.]|jgi:ABC-2 type transport system permease protein|nr:ABC transporter permease [Candidatus Ancillula sp.]